MKMKKEIFKQLDYWCEQYKIANDINHDLKETARISENIKALERVLEMKRFIKIGGMWLTVENLKELTELLETQETTDKEDPGGYCIFGENYDYEIRVNKDYDLILEDVTRY